MLPNSELGLLSDEMWVSGMSLTTQLTKSTTWHRIKRYRNTVVQDKNSCEAQWKNNLAAN